MKLQLVSLQECVIEGKREEVESLVIEALQANISPDEILNSGLIAAMKIVGSRFEEGEFFVPEMLVAARAMQSGLAILKPRLLQSGVKSLGVVIIGTVKGDLHDIGKNLVAMMLEGAGYEVIDLGTDVSAEKFVIAVKENRADLVGLSALLTTTMSNMRGTITALEVAGLRDTVKVIVGGAPLTENFAKSIGADGYAADASRAVAIAKSMLHKQS